MTATQVRSEVSTALTPPGRSATWTASPPAAGSRHKAAWPPAAAVAPCGPSAPSGSLACRPGRLEMNRSDPSGRNRGFVSPSGDRVSRTGPPSLAAVAGIRQMLVTYVFRSGASVWTAAASQLPSGDSRSAVTRGIAT